MVARNHSGPKDSFDDWEETAAAHLRPGATLGLEAVLEVECLGAVAAPVPTAEVVVRRR